MCVLNKANHSSSISSSDIQLSPIYVHLRKEYKHIFGVFSRNQEFQVCNLILLFFSQRAFAKKTKVSSYKPLREE